MNRSSFIWLGTIVGGAIGGYIPLLWGAGGFSMSSVILSGMGSMLGIYVAFKMTD